MPFLRSGLQGNGRKSHIIFPLCLKVPPFPQDALKVPKALRLARSVLLGRSFSTDFLLSAASLEYCAAQFHLTPLSSQKIFPRGVLQYSLLSVRRNAPRHNPAAHETVLSPNKNLIYPLRSLLLPYPYAYPAARPPAYRKIPAPLRQADKKIPRDLTISRPRFLSQASVR